MNPWLVLLLVQGVLGAVDTLWYHELVCALPARTPGTAPELRLHAARDFVYAVLFLTLPFRTWNGLWAGALALLLAAEIGITLADFALEDRVRAPFGGVARGERIMHTVMAIVYGAFLARFVPELQAWFQRDTGFEPREPRPGALALLFMLLGLGVFLSGLRDLGAAAGVRVLQRPLWSARARV